MKKGDKSHKPWKQPHKGRGWKHHEKREYERKAYVAAHKDVESDKDEVDVPARDDQGDDSSDSAMSEAGCYFARGNEDEDPEPETKEDVELVVFTAYTADDETIDEEDIAYLAQTEAAGFVAWNKAFAKGKSKGKGKGKGKFKRTFRYSHYSNGGRPPNRKTLEERKEALKKLKAKTKCKTCGAVGHWAGDQECPKKTRFGGLALSLPTTDVPMQPDVPPEDDQSIYEEQPPCPCADCLNGKQPRKVAHDMTDEYVMDLHKKHHISYWYEDDSSGNDPEQAHQSGEPPEREDVEYHLTAIEQPTQFVSYVATIVEDDEAEIPGGDTVLKYGPHKGDTYAEVLKKNPEFLEIAMKRLSGKTIPKHI